MVQDANISSKGTRYVINKASVLTAGGLIAISLIILQDLLSLNSLDSPQHVALISFCLALPSLGGYIFIYTILDNISGPFNYNKIFIRLATVFTILGSLADVIGIDASILHVSCIAALVFLCVALFVIIVCLAFSKAVLNQAHKEDEMQS